ncbi:hypothetical protein BU24DRAFT_127942 [Aaosphaeria arxii CBS 175.79]|uniref:Uncharacterized protein n=1 Tax=Aaosphaeria arxii CBS 175.79 TaxID=1450172 RepID=A0A6A5Y3K1_9PLEO|nr:uncharacterized protein BU24DRAFT_127942 [Aaosphaeria arxii CBS 175.79]KAF2019836.1 hypothetical protein BU24DRAFT_127942 [Aaosphaeria arxii CBS 175.79]
MSAYALRIGVTNGCILYLVSIPHLRQLDVWNGVGCLCIASLKVFVMSITTRFLMNGMVLAAWSWVYTSTCKVRHDRLWVSSTGFGVWGGEISCSRLWNIGLLANIGEMRDR